MCFKYLLKCFGTGVLNSFSYMHTRNLNKTCFQGKKKPKKHIEGFSFWKNVKFELGKCCFEKFIFIPNTLMLWGTPSFPFLAFTKWLEFEMRIFSYILMEDDNLSHVSALLAFVFFPKRGDVMFIRRYTLVVLKSYFDILL